MWCSLEVLTSLQRNTYNCDLNHRAEGSSVMNTYANIKCISLMTNLFIIFMFLIVLNEIKGQVFVYDMHFIALTPTNGLFIWLQFTTLGTCTHCIFLNINCFKDTECMETYCFQTDTHSTFTLKALNVSLNGWWL